MALSFELEIVQNSFDTSVTDDTGRSYYCSCPVPNESALSRMILLSSRACRTRGAVASPALLLLWLSLLSTQADAQRSYNTSGARYAHS